MHGCTRAALSGGNGTCHHRPTFEQRNPSFPRVPRARAPRAALFSGNWHPRATHLNFLRRMRTAAGSIARNATRSQTMAPGLPESLEELHHVMPRPAVELGMSWRPGDFTVSERKFDEGARSEIAAYKLTRSKTMMLGRPRKRFM